MINIVVKIVENLTSRNLFRFGFFSFMIFMFYILYFFFSYGEIDARMKVRELAAFLSISISLMISPIILSYLNKPMLYSGNYDIEFMRKELDLIAEKVRELSISNQNFDNNEIFKLVCQKIENESGEVFIKNLKMRIEREEIFKTEDYIKPSLMRLMDENQSLARRGNLNLVIGMLLSVSGLFILGGAIYGLDGINNFDELIIKALPRFSFVIMIEIFAFFFLNLYKKSLDDIKYYQNEITNLEAKYLSLQMAKSMNNHKLISSILEQIVKTERNFILEKDQSTIELEKERISSNNANNSLQAIKDIFKNQK